MKLLLFRYSIPLVYGLSAMVLVLLIAASLLYFQKTKMQTHNRTLILQNDSILSEYILLKNSVPRHENTTGGKQARFSEQAMGDNRQK